MAVSRSAQARAFWTMGEGLGALRDEALAPPADGEVEVETLFSGVSRGSEGLVFAGRVPQEEWQRMRAPFQAGDFPAPVKYGYCLAGRIASGSPGAGRLVFVLHPHQDRFVVPADAAIPVPEGVPAARAVLAANMETALNGLWDSAAGPGDRIVVVGAGAVGLLVGFLAAALPGAEVTMVDTDPARRDTAARLGLGFALPQEAPCDADVVFHASASAAGLTTAIGAAGREAAIVEMSWYGEGMIAVPLGGAFHAGRLRLIASQVGQVSPSRRPRWSHRRRLVKALELLRDPRLDALLGRPVPFAELPARFAAMLAGRDPCPLVVYPAGEGLI
ncbi:zinc-dependent alcohol dehydrogenase [Ancylobacter crimeensis]|uniref:zinc-dependent alcohol dehydrogenase n=1 Tax=Ancylobacter crimeensis TaxID=2579147 RepID=UPI003CCFEBC6